MRTFSVTTREVWEETIIIEVEDHQDGEYAKRKVENYELMGDGDYEDNFEFSHRLPIDVWTVEEVFIPPPEPLKLEPYPTPDNVEIYPGVFMRSDF